MAFCKSIKPEVKKILTFLDEEILGHIDVALKVTTAIQKFLISPVSDIVTALIPGQIDDTIKAKLIPILQTVVPTLAIMDSCKTKTTFEQQLSCFITNLKAQDPDLQQAILNKMAALITAKLHDQKLAQNIYDLLTQAIFSTKKLQS